MTTFYIYEIPGHKNGATINWDKRCYENVRTYGITPILIETMQGLNTPEFWQIVGDREWELADQNGYPRGTHYRVAREKRIQANLKGAHLGGAAHKGIPNIHLRSLTINQVLEIKSKYKGRNPTKCKKIGPTLVDLSKEYNVSVMTISNIINNKNYQT